MEAYGVWDAGNREEVDGLVGIEYSERLEESRAVEGNREER